MLVKDEPLKEWLKAKRTINYLHLDLMALRFDLDGALDARQLGLAWWALTGILRSAVQLHVADLGVPLVGTGDRIEQAFRHLRTLEEVNPELAAEAWRLWRRPMPAIESLDEEVDKTIAFVGDRLGLSFIKSREATVMLWATSTRILRTVAKQLGIADSDRWYVSDSTISAPDLDWYGEVIKVLEEERSS